MSWIRLALRRLRADRAPTAGLVLLILATAFVAELAPRILARLADEAVRTEVGAAPAAIRGLEFQRQAVLPAGPDADPLAGVRAAGLALDRTVATSIRGLIAGRQVVVQSGRFMLDKATTDPAFVHLRIQEGVADHVVFREGQAPGGEVGIKDDVTTGDVARVYEAAVSSETARRFGIAIGETLSLAGDPTDPLIGRKEPSVVAFARITGIYDVPDPRADYWFDDPLPIHPVIRALSAEVQFLDADLLLDERAIGPLAAQFGQAGRPLLDRWRWSVAADRIGGSDLATLVTDFRRLAVVYPSANVTAGTPTALRTGLTALLAAHLARWTAAESIFAVMALGPSLLAVATLLLIAIVAARRRQASMALARARGASAAQVLGPVLVEALLLAVPASAAATACAILAVPGGGVAVALPIAAGVVAIVAIALTATVVPIARSRSPIARAGARVVARSRGRRLVLEAVVVALATTAAWLLRERGVRPAGTTGELPGFDPLIAAVPALAGVAAGILAVRLLPVALALFAAIGRRGRGLIPMLAARRAMDGAASASVLLVLIATATSGAFAAATLDGLDRGADAAAWQDVGGSFRLETRSGPLPRELDLASLPGVEIGSLEFQVTVPIGLQGPPVLFDAVEAGALQSALAGTPVAPPFPDGFTTPGSGPIPALVSRSIAGKPRAVQIGEVFQMSIEGFMLEYRAVAAIDTFPGVPLGRDFMVVPREWIRAQAPEAQLFPAVAIVRAPATAAAALRDAVAALDPAVTVTGQAEDAAARRASPVTHAVRAVILAAALLAAAYAAGGIAAALALAGVARGREMAQLRTLGLTGRQGLALGLAEHGPTTVSSFIGGGALGVGLYLLLRPGLGIAELVGSRVDVPFVLDGGALFLVMIGMLVVVAVGVGLGVLLQRRVAPTAAMRGRFE